MNEREKLAEAEWFLVRLRDTKFDESGRFDRTAFEYYLSAFLSAGRAVLQRARKEARAKTGDHHWYESAVTNHPCVKFLRIERNKSIYDAQVVPELRVTVKIPGGIIATADGGLRHVDDDGNVLREVVPEPGGGPVRFEVKPDIIPRYYFEGWAGLEDVVTLCRQYLDEVAVIVADGQSRGFLTPDVASDGRKASQPDSVSMQVRGRREAPDHGCPQRA